MTLLLGWLLGMATALLIFGLALVLVAVSEKPAPEPGDGPKVTDLDLRQTRP